VNSVRIRERVKVNYKKSKIILFKFNNWIINII